MGLLFVDFNNWGDSYISNVLNMDNDLYYILNSLTSI